MLNATQAAWLRTHGIRRSPTGRAFYAETRGGHGHPVLVSAALVSGAWEVRVRNVPVARHLELRDALRALLGAVGIDSYSLT